MMSRRLPGFWLSSFLGLILLPLGLIAASHPSGFNFHWAQTVTGAGDQQANALAVDPSGQIHLTGSYVGTADFHGTTLPNASLAGTLDLFVARYRSSGELIWARSVSGPNREIGTGVAADREGNSFVAGHFQVGALVGGIRLTNLGNSDGLLLKYSPAGSLLWSRVLGGAGDDNATGVVTDAAGNAYVTGFAQAGAVFAGTALTNRGGVDVFLAKFDPSGTLLWARSAGGPGVDVANAVAVDGLGRVLVAGYFSETNRFGSFTLAAVGNVDVFLAQFDADGTVLWARSGGGELQDYAFAVAADVDGSVALTGTVRGAAQFGGEPLAGTGLRTYVARYGPEGTLTWVRAFTGNEARAVTWSEGGLFVAGNFLGTVQIGSQPLTSSGTLDAFVARYAGSGEVEWARSYGGAGLDHAYALLRDGGTGCLLAGRFTDIVSFDTGSVTNGGVGDAYLARLSPTPLLTSVPGKQTVVPGSDVEMTASAIGSDPLSWSWFFNQTNLLAGADTPVLRLPEVSSMQAGVYSVAVSNRFGAVTSSPAFLNVFGLPRPTVRVDGLSGARFDLTNLDQVTVTLANALPGASIFYTLDGSSPTLGSFAYTAPFLLKGSSLLRAIAYDAAFASSETPTIPITFRFDAPQVFVEGQSGSDFVFTNLPGVAVRLLSPLIGVPVFYTLDGTLPLAANAPASNALSYLAPFVVTQSVTLNAAAFRVGVTSAVAGPVSIRIVQEYGLDIDPPLDGVVQSFPPGRLHSSGTVVQLTAQAGLGWSLLNWTGDAVGTQGVYSIVMDRARRVGASFGTALSVTNLGRGSVRLEPQAAAYPRGTKIRAVAVPESGHYLALWGGVASGNVSPHSLTIQGPVPTLSALFSPLATNRFSLTLLPDARVSVRAIPHQVFYEKGTEVLVEALPDVGVGFAGWTGTLVSDANPLKVRMDSNLVLRAQSGVLTYLLLHSPELSSRQFSFSLTGPTGLTYQVERSLDALSWFTLEVLSNFSGEKRLVDLIPEVAQPLSLYRASRVVPSTNSPASASALVRPLDLLP